MNERAAKTEGAASASGDSPASAPAPGSAAPLLSAQQVGYRDPEGVERVRALDLRVQPGECVVLVGPAGSGKSQLLRVLFGFERPTHGELSLLGVDVRQASERELLAIRGASGFVFSEGALISNLSLRANIELPMRYRGELSERELRQRADSMIYALGIERYAEQRPAGLGLSVRKRAALARALGLRPRILFCDELLGFGDAQALGLTCEALVHARKRFGTACVLAEASAAPAASLGPRVFEVRAHTLVPLAGAPFVERTPGGGAS